jgi:hypothetical protein
MANNRKVNYPYRTQIVMSAPRRILVGKYLTKKGKRLMAEAETKAEKRSIELKYTKNRYTINDKAVPVRNKYNTDLKIIYHT